MGACVTKPHARAPAFEPRGRRSKRVLCAINGSEGSLRALQFARDQVHNPGDQLILFQAASSHKLFNEDIVVMVNHKWALVQGQAERRALRRLLELMNEHDIEGRCLVLMGDSRVLIPEIASKYKADLVVVGRGGRGKFKRCLLGSLSSHLVRRCPVPVVVVPPGPERNARPEAADEGPQESARGKATDNPGAQASTSKGSAEKAPGDPPERDEGPQKSARRKATDNPGAQASTSKGAAEGEPNKKAPGNSTERDEGPQHGAREKVTDTSGAQVSTRERTADTGKSTDRVLEECDQGQANEGGPQLITPGDATDDSGPPAVGRCRKESVGNEGRQSDKRGSIVAVESGDLEGEPWEEITIEKES